jgi:hypothetical protein
MQYRAKYHAMRALQLVGALIALSGLAKLGAALINTNPGGHVALIGGILVFGGVIIGIAATLLATYFGTKMANSNSDKIALDALNHLGEQYAKKRRQK